MTTLLTATTTLPLSQLVPSPANVRRTGKNASVDDLAASIAAHGLRQNLNVRPTEDGKRYEVVAGGRRLRALKLLAKRGTLPKDAPVPCRILSAEERAEEISLAENTVREAMHPDDQFSAFHALTEQGMPVEDVAARFGVTPALVERRLKLARVSPKLRALFRKGDLTLEHMMAFAISDDTAAQETVWRDLPQWSRSPRDIRAALTEETVPATDRLAVFVGLDAYTQAGGGVMRDLFDAKGEGYLTDRMLLLTLAGSKLAALTDTIRAEGWKWVKAEAEPDYSVHYRRVYALPCEDEDAPETFAPEDMARAGALLRIAHDGTVEIDRGLVHPDDVLREPREENRPERRKPEPGALAASIVEELTAHCTAALRIELARAPTVALAATVHALALPLLYGYWPEQSALAMRLSSEPLERHATAPADCPAHQAMQEEEARWKGLVPDTQAAFFGWCIEQPQEVLLALLAYAAASSVNGVQGKADRSDAPRLCHADALAEALHLDMAQHWQPSVEGFFGKLPKATLLHIVTEAQAALPVRLADVKKHDAARYVAQAMDGKGWLPAPLRIPLAA